MTGEMIKRQRLINGMSIGDLANRVGVHKATVMKWENNEIKQMSPCHVLRLMSVFPTINKPLRNTRDTALLNAFYGANDNVKQAILLLLNLKS